MVYPDEVLKDLAKNLRRGDSEKVLSELEKAKGQKVFSGSGSGVLYGGLDQAEIIRRTGLTYAITSRTLEGLKAAGFIKSSRQTYGRSSYYNLTDNGQRILELFKQEVVKK